MKILFDYGIGGEPEGSPPTFKQCAAADIHAAFLNPDEHGEVRTIRYDGVEYQDITVIEPFPRRHGYRPAAPLPAPRPPDRRRLLR